MALAGALADPEPAADPQYRSYSKYPSYEPSYPSYPKPSYHEPAYPSKPSYHEPTYPSKPSYPSYDHKPSYKKDYGYCDPRATPSCAEHANATFCLKDYEYPERDIQVSQL